MRKLLVSAIAALSIFGVGGEAIARPEDLCQSRVFTPVEAIENVGIVCRSEGDVYSMEARLSDGSSASVWFIESGGVYSASVTMYEADGGGLSDIRVQEMGFPGGEPIVVGDARLLELFAPQIEALRSSPKMITPWMNEHKGELDSYSEAQGHTYRQKQPNAIKWSEAAYGGYEW